MELADRGGRAVEVGDGDAVAAQLDDLVLAELDGLAGVGDEGGDVGGEEVLALAAPDHERGVAPGADDDVGHVGVGRDEGERALEPRQTRRIASARSMPGAHRRDLVPSRCATASVSVSEDISRPRASSSSRSWAKFSMIPLWMTATLPVQSTVRVGVAVGRAAVGGPAGVAHAGRSPGGSGCSAEQPTRLPSLPALRGDQLAARDQRHAGGVVAAVLQALQTREHDVERRRPTDIPTIPHMMIS